MQIHDVNTTHRRSRREVPATLPQILVGHGGDQFQCGRTCRGPNSSKHDYRPVASGHVLGRCGEGRNGCRSEFLEGLGGTKHHRCVLVRQGGEQRIDCGGRSRLGYAQAPRGFASPRETR
jgi:hypothetical protein